MVRLGAAGAKFATLFLGHSGSESTTGTRISNRRVPCDGGAGLALRARHGCCDGSRPSSRAASPAARPAPTAAIAVGSRVRNGRGARGGRHREGRTGLCSASAASRPHGHDSALPVDSRTPQRPPATGHRRTGSAGAASPFTRERCLSLNPPFGLANRPVAFAPQRDHPCRVYPYPVIVRRRTDAPASSPTGQFASRNRWIQA